MINRELLPTKIVVIHDDMDANYPLIVMLKDKYSEESVVLFKHSQEGLDFVLSNLGKRMVVLLDKNFKDKNDISGLKVFEKIREKTALVYVILISANSITDFTEDELKTLINRDLFKLEKFTNDYTDIIKLIDEAVNNTDMRVDSALEQWIALHPEEDKNKPFITTRDGKIYTLGEILEEIRLQTPYGKDVERKILMLAVDMLARGKKTSRLMINFHIAFDQLDVDLGNYFEVSKIDLVDFINAECNDHQIHEIPSNLCNQAYIDIRLPQINASNFIFAAYTHGNDDELVSNNAFFIKKDINSALFVNSFFYSMSCLTGKGLGKSLIGTGSHAFIGYIVEAEALLGAYMQISIDCDNHGIKNFIRGLRLQECFDGMKQHFTDKIDWLEASGEPLLAAYLLTNRDALVLEGNANLTLADFTIN